LDFDRSSGVGLFDVSGGRTFGLRLALRTTFDAEDGPGEVRLVRDGTVGSGAAESLDLI